MTSLPTQPTKPGAGEPELMARLAALPLHTFKIEAAGRCWAIEAVRDQDALLQSADQFGAFPYGLLLWDSAVALAETLADMGSIGGRRVLELGAGVGLAGLAARALGADVEQTDHAAEALELCRRNAARNGITGITTRLADWYQWHDEVAYDMIIGSDILYDIATHAPVASILEGNLRAGGCAILTDPGRLRTPEFLTRLQASHFTLTQHTHQVAAVHPLRLDHTVGVSVIVVRRR